MACNGAKNKQNAVAVAAVVSVAETAAKTEAQTPARLFCVDSTIQANDATYASDVHFVSDVGFA